MCLNLNFHVTIVNLKEFFFFFFVCLTISSPNFPSHQTTQVTQGPQKPLGHVDDYDVIGAPPTKRGTHHAIGRRTLGPLRGALPSHSLKHIKEETVERPLPFRIKLSAAIFGT